MPPAELQIIVYVVKYGDREYLRKPYHRNKGFSMTGWVNRSSRYLEVLGLRDGRGYDI